MFGVDLALHYSQITSPFCVAFVYHKMKVFFSLFKKTPSKIAFEVKLQ